MYKIFLDKSKTFQCNVDIEGASLNESQARLFLETDNYSLTFKGEISSDGVVKIPISKLKGVLEENEKGKISLEIIAEDTIFVPWEGEYETDISKKVAVSFDTKLDEAVSEPIKVKPKMAFSMVYDDIDTKKHLDEIFKILKKNNVNRTALANKSNHPIFNKLVETYCKLNYIYSTAEIKGIKKDLLKNIK